jgi:hypothetical protein
MLTDAYGLQAGQYSQFTDEEFARLKTQGVCKEIETEIETKAAPTKAVKTVTKKK